jgi:MtN3 and saliva related transmembrane protein
MEGKDILGWTSSMILLATLIKQVHKQWKEGTGEGVSRWLFVGQVFSSIGFTIYSYLGGDTVFTVTNAALLVNNFIGLGVSMYFSKKKKQDEEVKSEK